MSLYDNPKISLIYTGNDKEANLTFKDIEKELTKLAVKIQDLEKDFWCLSGKFEELINRIEHCEKIAILREGRQI